MTKKTEVEQLKAQLEEAKSAQLRALADLENYRRRENENKKNWVSFGIAEFTKQLLPHLLSLKLAAQHTADKDAAKVIEQFFGELEKSGLQAISPAPETEVDPDVHEVVMTEAGTPGKIVKTLESGWKFHDIVIAPAKVSTGTPPSPPTP